MSGELEVACKEAALAWYKALSLKLLRENSDKDYERPELK
jgi:hypothetical protein